MNVQQTFKIRIIKLVIIDGRMLGLLSSQLTTTSIHHLVDNLQSVAYQWVRGNKVKLVIARDQTKDTGNRDRLGLDAHNGMTILGLISLNNIRLQK